MNKYDRTYIHPQKRSHSPIPKVRSHPHPFPNTIALANSASTITRTSIPKHDRTHIYHQKRSHPHPLAKAIALSN
ncbi:hypothetical protein [Argonema antarcticum]|uniref:hypothetical protein n=1 Tax=Argonema antarcticum TaxID=2942763 RepID=UPI00201223EC|nr:hypothetical protein [Argonema antarcticum]MCL1473470.1 hypothetical protein [Argonema antarcticum A004/B2]